jgi:hypothetical protein
MRNVNNILRRNRRVLLTLNPTEKTTVHRNKLLEMGFNFAYHTSTSTTKSGSTYIFCYEQGYLPIENNFYLLVVRKETMV